MNLARGHHEFTRGRINAEGAGRRGRFHSCHATIWPVGLTGRDTAGDGNKRCRPGFPECHDPHRQHDLPLQAAAQAKGAEAGRHHRLGGRGWERGATARERRRPRISIRPVRRERVGPSQARRPSASVNLSSSQPEKRQCPPTTTSRAAWRSSPRPASGTKNVRRLDIYPTTSRSRPRPRTWSTG